VTTRATVLRHSGDGGPSVAAFGHVLVDVKPFAQATVVLEHTGSVTYADNVELRVGDGASLVVVSIADWDDDAVHVSQHNISLGRDARIKHVVVSFGGDVVRVSTNVAYDGPGGDAELLGLYFADAGQHLENRLFVDHAVPALPQQRAPTGAPCRAESAHTSGSANVLSAPRRPAPTRTRSTATWLLHPPGAGRLGAKPGDRDRRDHRRGHASATAGSTTSSCSTCRPAASPRGAPRLMSCAVLRRARRRIGSRVEERPCRRSSRARGSLA
jgi:hypothetical protein